MHSQAPLWQEWYRALFDRNVAGVIVTNHDGKIVDCNDPCANIFGLDSRVELLSHTAWDFYFDRQERLDALERLRSRVENPPEEIRIRKADGSPIWVLTLRTPLFQGNSQPQYFQGTIIDISARKLLQQRLRESEVAARNSLVSSDRRRKDDLELSAKISDHLRTINEALRPENLWSIDRNQTQEILRALETIKMFIADLEILRLP